MTSIRRKRVKPFSAKLIFVRKKKKLGNFIATLIFMLEREFFFFFFFFLSQLIELFHRTMKRNEK